MSGTELKWNRTGLLTMSVGTLVALACSAGGGSGFENENNGGSGNNGNNGGQGNGYNPGGGGGPGFQTGSGGNNPNPNGGSGGQDVVGPSVPPVVEECNDAGALAQFRGGGGAGSMRWLYPYDGTVFPRGLLPPVLQWEGSGGDQVYLRIETAKFRYEGCFPGVNSPARFPVPDIAWRGAGEWSEGYSDPATVTLAVRSGGSVTQIQEKWHFALANIKGAIYYNTYGSQQAVNSGAAGAVLKIVPGQPNAQLFLTVPGIPPTGPCVSCHSLSADGSTMVANNHNYVPGLASYTSASYDVTTGSASMLRDNIPEAGFGGVFRDGSFVVTNGTPVPSNENIFFPFGTGNVPALLGPNDSHLVDTRTGATVGAGPAAHAQMPSFSPDGRLVAYNDHDAGGGHSLHVADFDPATRTFSNQREIFRDATRYPGWPFITPDNKAVVFVLGTRSDFVSQLPAIFSSPQHGTTGRSNLRITYLNSPGTSQPLDLANGWRNGTFYLPGGMARDNDLEFFPTMSPVAAGGFFWVFFTSRRTYGNTTYAGLPTNDLEDPLSKKIWVTAININGSQGQDPSHPAFFLREQEHESGNVRAFAALEPCKEDGLSCTSGTECCSGFCTNGRCGPPVECSQLDDRCDMDSDCCNPAHVCIGGYCAIDDPIIR